MINDTEILQIVDYYLCVTSGSTYSIGDVLKKITYVNLLDGQLRDVWYNTSTAALVSLEPNVSSDVIVFNGDLFDKWDTIVGNSIEHTWVLSGSEYLLDTILYKNGANTILTKTFSYDVNNNVSLITTT